MTNRAPVLPLVVRRLGLQPYLPVYLAMQAFTDKRTAETRDEIWLLEHPPVYTLGQAATLEHVHDNRDISVVQTDRGGQVTYHGPGQLVAYVLLDIGRLSMGVRTLVTHLEQAVVEVLAQYHVAAHARRDAPGVYIAGVAGEAKIAAVGLRVRRGKTYHGLALNFNNDLEPYNGINPCGFPGLAVTRLMDHITTLPALDVFSAVMVRGLAGRLSYNHIVETAQLPCELSDAEAC